MERIGRHLTYANVAATLALVFATSGVGYAASGGFTSGGKLQACVNSEGGLRLLKPGKRCAKGQQAVAWNQAGAGGAGGEKGVTGAAGPTGAVGPAGATGAAGGKGSEGTKGAEGPKGANGESANVKWAAVAASTGFAFAEHGLRRSGGSGGGNYLVEFNQNVESCAITVTQIGSSTKPLTTAAIVTGAEVRVYLRETNGTLVESDFSIVANC